VRIEEYFMEGDLTRGAEHCCLRRDGSRQRKREGILTEHYLRVTLNGGYKPAFEMVCLPQFLPELVLGHLLTEGWIRSFGDVEKLVIRKKGDHAELLLDLAAEPPELQSVPVADWKPEWVFALADRFALGMPLHRHTYATHSCFLAKGGELLFACEEIGRHNALDKAVGYALRNGIDLRECLLYSSGRMPADMVRKAIRAGVPILAGKGSPTAEAVELARQYGLTLICAARQDQMKQFSGPEPREWQE